MSLMYMYIQGYNICLVPSRRFQSPTDEITKVKRLEVNQL